MSSGQQRGHVETSAKANSEEEESKTASRLDGCLQPPRLGLSFSLTFSKLALLSCARISSMDASYQSCGLERGSMVGSGCDVDTLCYVDV